MMENGQEPPTNHPKSQLFDMEHVRVTNPELQERVIAALRTVRIQIAGLPEASIRDELAAALTRAGIGWQKEYRFAPRCRADLWCQGVVVEVKKQRPPAASVSAQLWRYASQDNVKGIILVLERHMVLPNNFNGVPVSVLSLNALWGIAL